MTQIKSCVVTDRVPGKYKSDKKWLVITADLGGRVFGDRFDTEAEAQDYRKRTLAAGAPLRAF